jgi:hypothetical protein
MRRGYRNRRRWAEAASASGDPTRASIAAGDLLVCAEARRDVDPIGDRALRDRRVFHARW